MSNANRFRTKDFGTCLSFNGSTDNATSPDVASLRLPSAGTISCWVCLKSTVANQTFVGKSLNNQGWSLMYRTSGVTFEAGDNTSTKIATSNIKLPVGLWTHIAGVFNGANLIAYVNGVASAASASITAISDVSRLVTVGKGAGGSFDYCAGYIDEVAIWDTNFSASQITDLYYRDIVPAANLQAYWKLDEGSGTTGTDSSGNGRVLTTTGAAYATNVFKKSPRTTG